MADPTMSRTDAAELCAEPYPTWAEAMESARVLRAAGWRVIEYPEHLPRRPDGLVTVASVYHPETGDSPGDVLAAEVSPPPHDPGAG